MTKETEKAFVIVYSEYLRRRNSGIAKYQAVCFEDSQLYKIAAFEKWNKADIDCAVAELCRVGYFKKDILGNITLQNPGIEYMETKPKEYFSAFAGVVKDLLTLISAFLSL